MIRVNSEKGAHSIEIEGRTINLEAEISEVFTFEDRVVVLLETFDMTKDDPRRSRNAFALDRDGGELWRIEDLGHTYQGDDGKHHSLPWSTIVKKPNGSGYWIYSQSGYRFDFDPVTGKVAERGTYVH